ncbi:MAG: TIGR01212 family radical SAM protein [Bacillota bacterium]|nr:TIGR01212 family radical SAM protein [Bacillota bacterium]
MPYLSNPSPKFIRDIWQGKPYYSLDAYCKNTFGEKLYKVSLNAGFTCPNRDGTLGNRGCIFCSSGGSGDFASAFSPDASFHTAYERGIQALSNKTAGERYIAYFQAYTNTYGPLPYLEKIYSLALEEPSAAGISIATRPDTLPDEVIRLLSRLKEKYAPKFIWIELGLQTIHQRTADFIRRGYPLSCFEDTVNRLKAAKIPVITHVILGLPGEDTKDILETIAYLNHCPVFGIKLQLLHILRGTDLAVLYEKESEKYCPVDSLDKYLDILITCLTHLRPDMVVHRVTGDAPRADLIAPLWSANKRNVLNSLHRQMRDNGAFQGQFF